VTLGRDDRWSPEIFYTSMVQRPQGHQEDCIRPQLPGPYVPSSSQTSFPVPLSNVFDQVNVGPSRMDETSSVRKDSSSNKRGDDSTLVCGSSTSTKTLQVSNRSTYSESANSYLSQNKLRRPLQNYPDAPERGPPHFGGHEVRLPPCSIAPVHPTLSLHCGQRKALPLDLPPLRGLSGSKGLYEDHAVHHRSDYVGARNLGCGLHRRHTVCPATPSAPSGPSYKRDDTRAGLGGLGGEITMGTSLPASAPWPGTEFAKAGMHHSLTEASGVKEAHPQHVGASRSEDENPGSHSWEDNLGSVGVPASQTLHVVDLPRHGNHSEGFVDEATSYQVVSKAQTDRRVKKGPLSFARLSTLTLRSTVSRRRNSNQPYFGRLGLGVGLFPSPSLSGCLRPVGASRKTKPYHGSGDESSQVGTSFDAHSVRNQGKGSLVHGQCGSRQVYPLLGRPISCFETGSKPTLGCVSESWHNYPESIVDTNWPQRSFGCLVQRIPVPTILHDKKPSFAVLSSHAILRDSAISYDKTWQFFIAFIRRFFDPAQISTAQAREYVLPYLVDTAGKVSNIYKVTSVLKYGFALSNHELKFSPWEKLVIRGIENTSPEKIPKPRDPLLPSHITQMFADSKLRQKKYFIRDLCMMALGIRFCLRPKEVAVLPRPQVLADGTIRFTVIRCKSAAYQSREILVLEQIESDTCPNRLTKLWLAALPPTASHLFPGRTKTFTMSPATVNNIVKRYSAKIDDLKDKKISGHSLRIAGLVMALRSGLSETEAMAMGHWRSSAWTLYARQTQRLSEKFGF
jgi:hypothetical protein